MLDRIWRTVLRTPARWLRRAGFDVQRECSGVKDLREPIPDVQSPIDLEISIASDRDIQSIREVLVEPFKSEFEAFFDERDTCFVAKSNGRIAGYSWMTVEPFEISPGVVARYRPDAAYTYGSQVLPEFRGKKIFQCLTREVYLHLKSNGYRYACNRVAVDNIASIAARRRMGARMDKLYYLKLPWFPWMVFGRRHFALERGNLPASGDESAE